MNILVLDGRQLSDGGTFDKPRSLDDIYNEFNGQSVEWINLPHSNSSMIKKGKFPKGMTRQEVEKFVRGSFGGRFEHFNDDGTFKYIAYTD